MKTKILLFLILLIAFLVRIYKVDKVPPGLSNDEISIAYDAYSIVNTAKDGAGQFLPVSFKSHNDYKAPLYIYLTSPIVKILGNNEISVRFWSVVLGSLTPILLFYFIRELSNDDKVALVSAFLLAITPWHVYISRVAFESNVALFFLLAGSWFFLLAFKNPKYFFLSAIAFALSLYAYHTEKIFTPLVIVSLLFLFRRRLVIYKKSLFLAGALFLVLISPLLIDQAIHVGVSTRASTEIILKDYELSVNLKEKSSNLGKVFTIFSFWVRKYLGYVSPRYLFITGLPISTDFSNYKLGLMNFICLPFFLIGIKKLWDLKTRFSKFTFVWLFLAPLTPSLTLGELNLVRNLVSVVPLVTITALGVSIFWKNKKILILTLALILVNFAYIYYFYLFHFPKELAENWSYGFKEMAEYIGKNESKYAKIVVDPNYGTVSYNLVGVPDIFILYFNRINPKEYLSERYVKDGSLYFSRYEIRKVDWPKEKVGSKTLYVVAVHSNPISSQRVKEVYSISLPNGSKAFKFYESY